MSDFVLTNTEIPPLHAVESPKFGSRNPKRFLDLTASTKPMLNKIETENLLQVPADDNYHMGSTEQGFMREN